MLIKIHMPIPSFLYFLLDYHGFTCFIFLAIFLRIKCFIDHHASTHLYLPLADHIIIRSHKIYVIQLSHVNILYPTHFLPCPTHLLYPQYYITLIWNLRILLNHIPISLMIQKEAGQSHNYTLAK